MNTLNTTLRLLELGKKYSITQGADGLTYEITDYDNGLLAIIKGTDVTYYVTGAYDSGIDNLDINIKALDDLREFVEKSINYK